MVLDLSSEASELEIDDTIYPIYAANPEITWHSKDQEDAEEGCLSVPEERITVPRSSQLTLKYVDYYNKQQTLEASGWLARAIQHEMDHLNGITILNYLSTIKKDAVIRRLKKKQKQ